MSEKASKLIKQYLDKWGKDDDVSVREISAARLWQTGNNENQVAAEAIWSILDTNSEDIEEMKRDFASNKN